jgi:hypothetical protein
MRLWRGGGCADSGSNRSIVSRLLQKLVGLAKAKAKATVAGLSALVHALVFDGIYPASDKCLISLASGKSKKRRPMIWVVDKKVSLEQ